MNQLQRFICVSGLLILGLLAGGCGGTTSAFKKGVPGKDPLLGKFINIDETLLSELDYEWQGGYDANGNYIGEAGHFDAEGNYVGPGGYDEFGKWTGKGLFDSTGKYIGAGGGYDKDGNYVGPMGAFDKQGNYVGWFGPGGAGATGALAGAQPGPRPGLQAEIFAVTSGDQIISFAYDRHDIPAVEEVKIDGMAQYLRTNPQYSLVVEGHCDERGSEEYNMALGERRALAVRGALLLRGIEASRITTLSLGEESPRDPGHNESAWSKNRRVEMKLSGQ